MKVLIVEDNEDSRNLLAETVRAYGHEVIAAIFHLYSIQRPICQKKTRGLQ